MGFETGMRVDFADVDAAGIVYFARVLDYCHIAYERFLDSIGLPLPDLLADRAFLAPIVHAEADYRSPLRHGEAIRVEVTVPRIGRRSYETAYTVSGPRGLSALGRLVHATIDGARFEAIEVPERLREALQGHVTGA